MGGRDAKISLGPAIVLSLYWRRTTGAGVIAGMLAAVGGGMVFLYVAVIFAVMAAMGTVLNRLLPGVSHSFARSFSIGRIRDPLIDGFSEATQMLVQSRFADAIPDRVFAPTTLPSPVADAALRSTRRSRSNIRTSASPAAAATG